MLEHKSLMRQQRKLVSGNKRLRSDVLMAKQELSQSTIEVKSMDGEVKQLVLEHKRLHEATTFLLKLSNRCEREEPALTV